MTSTRMRLPRLTINMDVDNVVSANIKAKVCDIHYAAHVVTPIVLTTSSPECHPVTSTNAHSIPHNLGLDWFEAVDFLAATCDRGTAP